MGLMSIFLTNEELEALQGMRTVHICLYIFGLRRYMDYETGLVGIKRKISFQSLTQELYEEPENGIKTRQTPSIGMVRRSIEALKKRGLIKNKSIYGKQLIFECVLARSDKSVQNKPGRDRARIPARNPARIEVKEQIENINTYENDHNVNRHESQAELTHKPGIYPLSGISKSFTLSHFVSTEGENAVIPFKASLVLSQDEPKLKGNAALNAQAVEVLTFLNEKTQRRYRAQGANLRLIVACLKSGATVMDCKQVIAKKNREWSTNPDMEKYLRPKTLFNATNFEQYLGELMEK